jgi:hypothetical protein
MIGGKDCSLNPDARKESMTLHLAGRDLATILAALRYGQQDLAANEDQSPISPEHFHDQLTPLTVEEIDNLCERLNCGSTAG